MNFEAELTNRRINVLFQAASNRLATKGEVNLGLLTFLITTGHHWAHVEYAELIAENQQLFSDVEEPGDLYELVLNMLEQRHGPLVCKGDERKASSAVWGYAHEFPSAPGPQPRGPMTAEEVMGMWARRIRALNEGHPDQLRYNDHELPFTTWVGGACQAH